MLAIICWRDLDALPLPESDKAALWDMLVEDGDDEEDAPW